MPTSNSFNASTTGLPNVIGCSQARFLGLYSGVLDKPYEKPTLNTGIFIDEELSKLLAEDRRSEAMVRHHRRKDEVKAFVDELERYKSVTGVGKGKK